MFSAFEKRGYTFGKKIGKGSTSIVLRATQKDKKTGKTIDLACKIVDKKKEKGEFMDKFFPREIELLSLIKHDNLIGVHGIFETKDVVFIFLRLAENADLLKYILKIGHLPEDQSKTWFLQLAEGINYLHNLGYAHRDIKCENILISAKNNLKVSKNHFWIMNIYNLLLCNFIRSPILDTAVRFTTVKSRRSYLKRSVVHAAMLLRRYFARFLTIH